MVRLGYCSDILKGHWHEKSMSNKHMGACIWSEIWAANVLKFLIRRLKAVFLTLAPLMLNVFTIGPGTADLFVTGPWPFHIR
jgi:hypothetical protein